MEKKELDTFMEIVEWLHKNRPALGEAGRTHNTAVIIHQYLLDHYPELRDSDYKREDKD